MKPYREQIDDYKDSVFAIIGFMNLFRFDDDTKSIKPEIKVFQGRIMKTSSKNKISPNNNVTPDFCIQDERSLGIVGEVKKSFPLDRELWIEDFKQLMSYDDDLGNWHTASGKIKDHEIVLLPEQSRSRAVRNYYEEKNGKEISFSKNFIIVEFNRNDQVNSYFFFRKEHGTFKYFPILDRKLDEGIQVPTLKLMPIYEKYKLYDSKPPLPYLIYLIWENVIMLAASASPQFRSLRKNSKMPISISIDVIVNSLYEDYSFKKLNSSDDRFQPKIPLTVWVKEAINVLIASKIAEWDNETNGTCTVNFKKIEEALDYFIELCKEHELVDNKNERQKELPFNGEDKLHYL